MSLGTPDGDDAATPGHTLRQPRPTHKGPSADEPVQQGETSFTDMEKHNGRATWEDSQATSKKY